MALVAGGKVVQESVLPPYSNATNAFDLCMDVAKAIREEPMRFSQDNWYTEDSDFIRQVLRGEGPGPACGTMACRAGWMVILARTPSAYIQAIQIQDTAFRLLGVKDAQASYDDYDHEESDEERTFRWDVRELFDGEACTIRDDQRMRVGPAIGTPEYAEMGAKGVEEFARKWEARLRAKAIQPPVGAFSKKEEGGGANGAD